MNFNYNLRSIKRFTALNPLNIFLSCCFPFNYFECKVLKISILLNIISQILKQLILLMPSVVTFKFIIWFSILFYCFTFNTAILIFLSYEKCLRHNFFKAIFCMEERKWHSTWFLLAIYLNIKAVTNEE